jgi:uncharacterized membrane protein YeaQ/YmgE (transglycosylase-associated protein family)
MQPDPKYAAPLWVLLGAAAGLLAWRMTRARGLFQLAFHGICGLLGALAGGLLTFALTAGRPERGGFFTSLMTSAIGTLLGLGLCKAALDDPRNGGSASDEPAPPSTSPPPGSDHA